MTMTRTKSKLGAKTTKTRTEDAEVMHLTCEYAEILNEKTSSNMAELTRLLQTHGREFMDQVLTETIRIMHTGGMRTASGNRTKTMGGTFFAVAYSKVTRPGGPSEEEKWRHTVNASSWLMKRRRSAGASMNVTLKGNPIEIIKRRSMTMFAMSVGITIDVPRGFPRPPIKSTKYVIYATNRQWRDVEQDLKNENTKLVVIGQAVYVAELKGMVVYATKLTTETKTTLQTEGNDEQTTHNDEPNDKPGKPE